MDDLIKATNSLLTNKDYIGLIDMFSKIQGLVVSTKNISTTTENDLLEVIESLLETNKILTKELLKKEK